MAKKFRKSDSVSGPDVGPRLRELRVSQGLQTAELAARAGVYPNSISRWENGSPIKPAYLDKVAKALKTTPYFLKTGEQPTAADVSPPPKQNGHPESAPPPPGTAPPPRPPGGHSVETQLAPLNAAMQAAATRDQYRSALSTPAWAEFVGWLEASPARSATAQPWMIEILAMMPFPEWVRPTTQFYRGVLRELVQCQLAGMFD